MIDKITTVLVTALVVTAVGIALRPKAPTAKVISAATTGFANIERATYGPA